LFLIDDVLLLLVMPSSRNLEQFEPKIQWQEIIFYTIAFRSALRSTPPPIQLVLGDLSSVVKRPGHEAGHSPSSIAEVKDSGTKSLLLHMSSWRFA
jgi:hypothetical protein